MKNIFQKKLTFGLAWLLAILALLAIGELPMAWNSEGQLPALPNSAELGSFEVLKIIDGDTILVDTKDQQNSLIDKDQMQVRLIGIDTPEIGQPLADEATELTKNLISQNQVRLVRDVQLYDKYNRILAYVFVDDKDNGQSNDVFVNLELAKAGLAKILSIAPDVKLQPIFAIAQLEAQNKKLGIWK